MSGKEERLFLLLKSRGDFPFVFRVFVIGVPPPLTETGPRHAEIRGRKLLLAHLNRPELEYKGEQIADEAEKAGIFEDVDEICHAKGCQDGQYGDHQAQGHPQQHVEPVPGLLGGVVSGDENVEVVDDDVAHQGVC